MSKPGKLDFSSDKKLYFRLLGYVAAYKLQFAGGILSLVLLALTEPAIAALMKPLLDGTFVDKDPGHILWMPIILVLLSLVRGLFTFLSNISTVWIGGRLVFDLRQDMMDKLLVLSTSHYDHHSAGNIIAKLTHHVSQVSTAATRTVTALVRDSVKVLGLLVYALYLNWQLTLLIFLIMPPIAWVVNFFAKRSRHYSRVVQENVGELTHILEESVQGHKVVKIFGGQQYEKERLKDAANRIRLNQFKVRSAGAANVPIVELMSMLVLASIIYLGTSQTAAQQMSVGEFVSFFTALALIISPVKSLAGISQPLQRGLAAAESVFNFIDEEPEVDEGTASLDAVRGKVEFRQVCFAYPGVEEMALKGISFVVPQGKTVALVGPSGSGKTTVANLLPRFYNLSSGEILLDDQNVSDLKLADLRDQISLVNQDLVLFNDTVAANIAYGLKTPPSHEALRRAAEQAFALDFIEVLPNGFDTLIGDNGVLLSGGQRQRIAIARALLKDSPVLILDEATSALDSESEKQVQAALENLENNRTTLVIAHRLSTIQRADEILVLVNGEIIERGRHRELLGANGYYTDLYHKQFEHGLG